MQGNVLIGKGTVLYSDLGNPVFTIIEDTCGSHDTIAGCCSEIAGCCSEANNFLRYGVRNTRIVTQTSWKSWENSVSAAMRSSPTSIFSCAVRVDPDGRVAIVDGISKAGSYVDLRAEHDALAVLSNCPQMHNPCNAF